jgi:hypothetical protein
MTPTSAPFARPAPSTRRRCSRGLALAGLLMTAAALAVASPVALAVEQKPAAKAAKPAAAGAGPSVAATAAATAAVAAAAAASADLLRRRRQEIARILEGHLIYRGGVIGDGAKLRAPKIAGPFERNRRRSLFSSTITPEILYCVSAEVVLPIQNAVADTLMIIEKTDDGHEKYEGKISITTVPQECLHADFKPFPEMEQLRAKRRLSMGKTD